MHCNIPLNIGLSIVFFVCFFYQYLGFSIGLLSVSLLVLFTCVLFTCLCQKIQSKYAYIGEERNIVSDSCRNFCCSNCFVGNLSMWAFSRWAARVGLHSIFQAPSCVPTSPLSLSLSHSVNNPWLGEKERAWPRQSSVCTLM